MNKSTQQRHREYEGAIRRLPSLGIHRFVRNLSLIATGSVALIAVFLLAGIWRSGTGFFTEVVELFEKPQPEARVDVRSLVVQQVRNASELTTAVYVMETVVPASRDRTVGGYVIGTTTLLYIAYGEVRAGVDLSALRPEDVQVSGNALTLRLPPPKVLDSKIDVNRSKVYDYDRGFMGLGPDVAPELQELAQRTTLEKITESACAGGVLQQANDRAKLAISQLLSTAGYSQLTVETQAPLPDACLPIDSPVVAPAPTSPTIESLPAVPVTPSVDPNSSQPALPVPPA
ncbi:DUF4230 domain-containing protein [Phormidium tenue FACHB-886]|nr:DUF4230 domain-containing protein [Phormidium tenue FACHB-886]